MDSSIKLTVIFEGEFWAGIFERSCGEEYAVSRVVFGAEPKDFELYEFVLRNFYVLNFSKPIVVSANDLVEKKINPKRYQRQIKKEVETKGIGTKAQLALKSNRKLIN